MKNKVIELIETARSTPGCERSIGSNFGFALGAEGQRDVASEYGDAIGVPVQLADDDPAREVFLRGYLTAVRDVAMAFVRGVDERRATDLEALASWIASTDGAFALLKLARARQIVRQSDVDAFLGEHWPTSLDEMVDRRLLQALPGAARSYALTLLGERVLERQVPGAPGMP
jgi:hypothetical protein